MIDQFSDLSGSLNVLFKSGDKCSFFHNISCIMTTGRHSGHHRQNNVVAYKKLTVQSSSFVVAKIGGDDGPKSNVVIRPHSTPNVEEDCNGSTNTDGRKPFSAKAVHLDPGRSNIH